MTKNYMLRNLKKKMLLLSICSGLQLFGLTGCTKEMDCNIEPEHVHQYVDDDGLKKYISSEKQNVGNFYWTNIHSTDPEIIENVCKNNLCIVSENTRYLNNVISKHTSKREAYIYDYVYGQYYGYGYGYNASTGKYGYGSNNLITGYHYEYVWKEISFEEYVTDPVRDYSYEFKFYKIDENGNLISKNFKSLEDVEEDYKYFIKNDFVQEYITDSYYLDKDDVMKKTLKN